ncbi:MAG: 5'-nucleotidase C-terminal domain-containing protein, partial [Rhodobacterales bacterium]|nr:5'-nucleotidase C-terminal domain-containing protein [Rhodobacterales bacterium]
SAPLTEPLSEPRRDRLHLRLMATTDLHAHVFPWDYVQHRQAPAIGLTQCARLVAALRAGAANTLLLDNGDLLQGSALADTIRQASSRPNPVIAAMNALGYDAAAPGNHDFDLGLPFLRAALDQATFPFVCSNLDEAPALGLAPQAILTRHWRDGAGQAHAVRVGLAGFLPALTGSPWGQSLTVRPAVAAARAAVARLRAAGADLVIALCHSGIGAPDASALEDSAVATALAGVAGVDVVVAGHSHQVFPAPGLAALPGVDPVAGRLMGKPAVLAGARGSHLGVIDLALDRQGPGWRVADSRSVALPATAAGAVRAAPPLPAADLAPARAAHRRTLRRLNRPVGSTQVQVHSHFAQIAESPAVRLVAEAQRWRAAQALAGTAAGAAGLPLLSAAAPFRAGGFGGPDNYTDIAPGPLSERHLSELYPFADRLVILELTGAQLRTWLEHAAAGFPQLHPDRPDQPLIDDEVPSFGFDMILGLTYVIDLMRAPRAGRIRDLSCAGRPVGAQDRFHLAASSYRAGGGGGFPSLPEGALLHDTGLAVREALADYLARTGPWVPNGPPGWRLAAAPGTTAVLATSPRALQLDVTLPGLKLQPLGGNDRGFARVAVQF